VKPYRHARNSVKKYGGEPEDYLPIHNFMDVSKSAFADMRHRAIFHNSLGPYVVERVFGMPLTKLDQAAEKFDWSEDEKAAVMGLLREAKTENACSMINSDGARVQVRDVAEDHVIEDLGRIPPLADWLKNMQMQTWYGGPRVRTATKTGLIPFANED
jgi:hypothetical protein